MPEKQALIRIQSLLNDNNVPSQKELQTGVAGAVQALKSSNEKIRPFDEQGNPGGIIYLDKKLPVLIIPDLHSRPDFIYKVLISRIKSDYTCFEQLLKGKLQILFLGDAMHSEYNCRQDWIDALIEYEHDYYIHVQMDTEMRKALHTVLIVALLLTDFPDRCFFLKGNHENIKNENGNGNFPFGKYAREGEMVRTWMRKFLGRGILDIVSEYEKSLPVLAIGNRFMATHAEPLNYYSQSDLINYKNNPEVVSGLTWTANGSAADGSVQDMLKEFFGDQWQSCVYIGGHRTIDTQFERRAGGYFYQIHNPAIYNVCYISENKPFDPKQDIFELN